MRRYLLLEDGDSFEGKAFGSSCESGGEVVFNTSFTGFYEIMTDPSYGGQIIVFNFPSMFYYDYSMDMAQSSGISAQGIVVKDGILPGGKSFYRLNELLKSENIPGIYGVDTRRLTKKIRDSGNIRGIISNSSRFPDEFPAMQTEDLLRKFSIEKNYNIQGREDSKILFIDMGTKTSLIREMRELGSLDVVNLWNMPESYEEYDCIFLSNGPGDPGDRVFADLKEQLKKNLGKIPMVGVCLGHQIIGQVLGGRVEKMKFGHHGSNHAVGNHRETYITSHNHNFRISEDSLLQKDVNILYRDMNDGTPEMIEVEDFMILSSQFHPEGSPGPRDSTGFFQKMRGIIDGIKN